MRRMNQVVIEGTLKWVNAAKDYSKAVITIQHDENNEFVIGVDSLPVAVRLVDTAPGAIIRVVGRLVSRKEIDARDAEAVDIEADTVEITEGVDVYIVVMDYSNAVVQQYTHRFAKNYSEADVKAWLECNGYYDEGTAYFMYRDDEAIPMQFMGD